MSMLQEFKQLLLRKPRMIWVYTTAFCVLLFLFAILCLALLSAKASPLTSYEDVLLQDIKPTMLATGDLDEAQANQLIAFGEVLDNVLRTALLLFFAFVIVCVLLRTSRDYLIWQEMHSSKLARKNALRLTASELLVGRLAATLALATLLVVQAPGLLLGIWVLIYFLAETSYLYILGRALASKHKKQVKKQLLAAAQLLAGVITITLLYFLGALFILLIVALPWFLPIWLSTALLVLLLFIASVKLTAAKLVITKRLFGKQ
mgnify:CR=1 FL=1